MWHQLSKNSKRDDKLTSEVICGSCKVMICNLEHQKRRSEVSPERKRSRQMPSSRYKLQYLSPASTTIRKRAAQKERSSDKAKLAKHEEDRELLLDCEQSEELCTLMKTIEETCPDKLQEIFQEGENHSIGNLVRDSWELDKRHAKESFFKDQINNSEYML